MYKERVVNLLEAINQKNENDPSVKDFIYKAVKSCLDNFVGYTNSVYMAETTLMVNRFRTMDTQEYQEAISRTDTSRRNAHEAAIASTNMLNRICDSVGVARVYDGPDDRIAIGDFCGQIVNEFFEDRSGRTIQKEEVEKVFDQEVEGIERE